LVSNMEKISFTAADGFVLKGLWAVPVAAHKGTIIINAATGVKKEYYLRFAQYVVQNGYKVLLYDYRGIGESAPATLKGFNATMHEWGTLDMNAALNYVVKEKNIAAIIWIGHSVGAQMMGLLDQRQAIEKVIAINASTGYWNYFTFPYNYMVLGLWLFVGPPLTILKGYAPMDKLGWGEALPSGVYFEWRKWCLSKYHFTDFLQQHIGAPTFTDFKAPITAVHTSDDYIANTKTIAKLLEFYPNSPNKTICITPADYGVAKIGHTGIFRKKFENNLWPLVIQTIEA
jgi:predicted alpha/beta hydrolase